MKKVPFIMSDLREQNERHRIVVVNKYHSFSYTFFGCRISGGVRAFAEGWLAWCTETWDLDTIKICFIRIEDMLTYYLMWSLFCLVLFQELQGYHLSLFSFNLIFSWYLNSLKYSLEMQFSASFGKLVSLRMSCRPSGTLKELEKHW